MPYEVPLTYVTHCGIAATPTYSEPKFFALTPAAFEAEVAESEPGLYDEPDFDHEPSGGL